STVNGGMRRTGSKIIEGYGMSETAAISHINPLDRPKTGSFGCPVALVEAAVINAETLEFVNPGETGELVLAGPNVMAGYWNRPAHTARAIRFRTRPRLPGTA